MPNAWSLDDAESVPERTAAIMEAELARTLGASWMGLLFPSAGSNAWPAPTAEQSDVDGRAR